MICREKNRRLLLMVVEIDDGLVFLLFLLLEGVANVVAVLKCCERCGGAP